MFLSWNNSEHDKEIGFPGGWVVPLNSWVANHRKVENKDSRLNSKKEINCLKHNNVPSRFGG